MIDKITNKIVEAKYLGALVDTFSKAVHYAVMLGLVYLICGIIPYLNFINSAIANNFELIMLLLYIYIGYSLIDDVIEKQKYGVLIISILSFKIMMQQFTSINLIFFVLWIKIVMEMFRWISKLKFKMLEKIPPVVEGQVNEYIYYSILLVITFAVAYIFSSIMTSPVQTLQQGLTNLLNFLPLYLFFMFMMQWLWSKGLHGDQTVGRLIDVLLIIMIWSNLENLINNTNTTYTINASFHLVFGLGTGSGMTGMLLLALKIFNKQDVSEISQGSMFSINEPVILGLPIASNKDYTLPFIVAPLLSITFGWYMTYIGFARALTYPIFWGTPPLLRSFLASGGHLQTVLTEFLCYVIVFVVYAIFIVVNKKKGDA